MLHPRKIAVYSLYNQALNGKYLNTIVKYAIATGIIGVGMWAVDRFSKAAKNFTVTFKRLGIPQLSSGILTVPVDLQFNNTTGITITIPDFTADLYILKQGVFTKAGIVQQPMQLAPGISEKRLLPQFNLRQVFGGNLLNTIDAVLTSLQTRSITIKAEARGTANGISFTGLNVLPQQTITL